MEIHLDQTRWWQLARVSSLLAAFEPQAKHRTTAYMKFEPRSSEHSSSTQLNLFLYGKNKRLSSSSMILILYILGYVPLRPPPA